MQNTMETVTRRRLRLRMAFRRVRPSAISRRSAIAMPIGPAATSRRYIAFVATNSITQGEQVAQLWPLLFDRYSLEISFAHRTFAWISDARGSAQVHCVILGLAKRKDEPKEKRLFSYSEIYGDPVESVHSALSPYLFDASQLNDRHLVIREESKSLRGAPPMVIGSKPIDGGYLIFNDDEKAGFLAREPRAAVLAAIYWRCGIHTESQPLDFRSSGNITG